MKGAGRRSFTAATPSAKSSVSNSLACSAYSWAVASRTRSARSPRWS